MLQLLDLKEGELEWLANHLGHDINIHRDVYRLHESTIEITKVSKLLLAMERGAIHQFHGKTLQEIEIAGTYMNTYHIPSNATVLTYSLVALDMSDLVFHCIKFDAKLLID